MRAHTTRTTPLFGCDSQGTAAVTDRLGQHHSAATQTTVRCTRKDPHSERGQYSKDDAASQALRLPRRDTHNQATKGAANTHDKRIHYHRQLVKAGATSADASVLQSRALSARKYRRMQQGFFGSYSGSMRQRPRGV